MKDDESGKTPHHYLQLKLKTKNKLNHVTKNSFQIIKDAKNSFNGLHQSQNNGIPDRFVRFATILCE